MAHPGHARDPYARTSPTDQPGTDQPGTDQSGTDQPGADESSEQEPAGPSRRRYARPVRVLAPLAALAVAATAVVAVVTAPAEDADAGAEATQAEVAVPAAIGNVVDRRDVDVASRGQTRAADDPSTLADNPQKLQRAYTRSVRRTATYQAVQNADTKRWTTADLNLWTLPGGEGKKAGLLPEKKRILVTGRQQNGRTEVVFRGKSRWITAGYLALKKPVEPKPEPKPDPEPASSGSSSSSSSSGSSGSGSSGSGSSSSGSSGSSSSSGSSRSSSPSRSSSSSRSAPSSPAPSSSGTCTNGTSLSSGVSPNLVSVHQAVCASFPEITSYGDFRGDGEHAQGIAVDIMVSGSRGQQVADFVRANAGSLGVNYVIYAQRIWSTQRASEGWRAMSDRGSTTANHYDHVHVTVN